MRDSIRYKAHMMHSVQQFYVEDIVLSVQMSESEYQIPMLEDQRNDGNLRNQHFTFPEL